MSTEHQQYSPENQTEALSRYAQSHGMEIVRTYTDHGRSGLNVEGREGLKQLLADVQAGTNDFSAVLIYDISRWGRFQDADESAYYEYILKRAGKSVHYCAEQFENDGSLPSTLLKSLKRTMAGEYSRELSVKVFAGQCRLIEHGFRQGGLAGYGLRRQLLDRDGNSKMLLEIGQRKSLQTDRVVLVRGPDHEVDVIREIYKLFFEDGRTEREIAGHLNAVGIRTDLGHAWSRGTVHQVLINPKYIGSNVYNRQSFKLKHTRVKNPPDMWIVKPNAFASIIPEEDFKRAQEIITTRHRHWSDYEMLDALHKLLSQHGHLSGLLIDESDPLPSSVSYSKRFGSLPRAYKMIGWLPLRDFSYIEINRQLRSRHRNLCETIAGELRASHSDVAEDENGLLRVNNEFSLSVIISRCLTKCSGYRWRIRFDRFLNPDITIAVRLMPDNTEVLDYYIFPSIDSVEQKLSLQEHNHLALDIYRFESLECLYSLASRVRLEDIA